MFRLDTKKEVTQSRVTNNGTITKVYTGCAESARKRGSMADKNAVFLTGTLATPPIKFVSTSAKPPRKRWKIKFCG